MDQYSIEYHLLPKGTLHNFKQLFDIQCDVIPSPRFFFKPGSSISQSQQLVNLYRANYSRFYIFLLKATTKNNPWEKNLSSFTSRH